VNLGARVESLTKKFGAHILITEFTMNKIRNLVSSGDLYRISIRGLEKVQVKGKEKPVEIFEVAHAGSDSESTIRESESDAVSRFEEK
jgi:adenylate cyclase